MRFISETTADGVSEQHFTLDDVPGVLWLPVDPLGTRPLVLLGHGGGQHKKAPGVVARARRFTARGWAAAAIDAPGHGDRPRGARDEEITARLRAAMAGGEKVDTLIDGYNAALAAEAVPEWRRVLDALQEVAGGPVGYWGAALGTGIGVPLVADEPRIVAAVFGVLGIGTLGEAAARISVPVEFLMQWDDELVLRESALALFDAFASGEKSLHANAGRHMDVPRFEVDSSERFFARHLG